MPDELAAVGRAVMREAVQHSWDAGLQQQCGWADEGEAMIQLALTNPSEAQTKWAFFLETDGARGYSDDDNPLEWN